MNGLNQMTSEELVKELSYLSFLGYEQYCLYPEDSVEQKRILKTQNLICMWLNLLMDADFEPKFKDIKEEILCYVKQEITQEQARQLKEIELSTKFLNGGIKCTIQA
jgi:hypothetical protein